MRLFLGVFPSPDVRHAIERFALALQREPGLAAGRGGARWVRPERWHVTLAFLGEQDPDLVPDLLAAGRDPLATLPAFTSDLAVVGGFPKSQRARVLWLGVGRGREEFEVLGQTVREVLEEVGIETESREFHPHLTLARAGRSPLRVPARTVSIPGFEVGEVRLVHSRLGPGGGYEVVGAWGLGRG